MWQSKQKLIKHNGNNDACDIDYESWQQNILIYSVVICCIIIIIIIIKGKNASVDVKGGNNVNDEEDHRQEVNDFIKWLPLQILKPLKRYV